MGVSGHFDGGEVDLNRKIIAVSLDPFSNFTQPKTALLYLVECG